MGGIMELKNTTAIVPVVQNESIPVPAQVWEKLGDAYSTVEISEAAKGTAPGVALVDYRGMLYTTVAICHGGYSGSYTVECWQLVPRSCFVGECFYKDPSRNSYQNLIVQHKGKKFVMSKKVIFERELPTVNPIQLAEAQVYDSSNRGSGWRAMMFQGLEPIWKYCNGHPVAIYDASDNRSAVLFWKIGKQLHEYHLGKAVHDVYLADTNVQIAQKSTTRESDWMFPAAAQVAQQGDLFAF